MNKFRVVSYALTIGILAWLSLQPLIAIDIYWHLRMGLDWIDKGLLPFTDHYSFTMPGASIHYVAWPFQILTALFYKAVGEKYLFILLRIFFWLIPLPLIATLAKKQRWEWYHETFFLLFYIYWVTWRNEPRPDMISYFLIYLEFILLFSWRDQLTLKKTLQIAGLLLFWTNFHLSSLFGFALFLCFAVEKIILLREDWKSAKAYLQQSVIIFSVGFFNHEWVHPLFYPRPKTYQWAKYITEFDFQMPTKWDFPFKVSAVLLILAIAFFVKKKKVLEPLFITGLLLNSIYQPRLFSLVSIVTLPFLISYFQMLPNQRIVKEVLATISIILVYGIFQTAHTQSSWARPEILRNGFCPNDTLRFIKENNIRGKVFNNYDFGGCLIFRAAENMQVFIDGRTAILYPLEHTKLAFDATADVGVFHRVLEIYPFDYVLAGPNNQLFETSIDSGLFGVEFVGLGSTLLKRKSDFIPVTSILFQHPECLPPIKDKKILLPILESEYEKAVKRFYPKSRIIEFLSYIISYYRDEKFIITAQEGALLKLKGVLSFRAGEIEAALETYGKVSYLNRSDRLFAATQLLNSKKYQQAERFLNFFPSEGMTDRELYGAYQILATVNKKVGLKTISPERFEGLQSRVSDFITGQKEARGLDICTKITSQHKQ
ncbi:MAG: hypothetical protein A4S09_12200 [Proteobacteria bacterium SG_bin7]|nr:MAG: hypothetical protein A4S09_12200 [Proteobacteria bacterium SG_bin7]